MAKFQSKEGKLKKAKNSWILGKNGQISNLVKSLDQDGNHMPKNMPDLLDKVFIIGDFSVPKVHILIEELLEELLKSVVNLNGDFEVRIGLQVQMRYAIRFLALATLEAIMELGSFPAWQEVGKLVAIAQAKKNAIFEKNCQLSRKWSQVCSL